MRPSTWYDGRSTGRSPAERRPDSIEGEHVQVHPEVRTALAEGRPVVALESTIISHGLPRPENLRIAREIEDAVRSGGAVPATIAVLDGEPHVGLDDVALERIALDGAVAKAG